MNFNQDDFSYEIVVVDNQSNDGKLEAFQKDFSSVKFVLNSGNNGFANGCNVGAAKSKGDYLLFLNPDTIANDDAIRNMWTFAKKNPNVGITSCLQKKIKGGYEKIHRNFLSFSTLFGFFRIIKKIFSTHHPDTNFECTYTDWVSGSVVFMSREWFNQIGGWNEDYWMYYEDMDLSKRVHNANGQVALLNNVEIIHNHGGSSRINIKTASLTKTEVLISKHVFISNHMKGLEKLLSFFVLIISNLFIKILLGFSGVIFFFVPKLRLNVYLSIKMIRYYFKALATQTWLSPNSMNNKK